MAHAPSKAQSASTRISEKICLLECPFDKLGLVKKPRKKVPAEIQREYDRRYRERHKEAVRAKNLRYLAKHREELYALARVRGRIWYQKNRLRVREKHRLYYRENRRRLLDKKRAWAADPRNAKRRLEYVNEWRRQMRLKNPEWFRSRSRDYARKNPKKVAKLAQESYRRHTAKRRADSKRIRLAHPERALDYRNRRRSRKLLNGPTGDRSAYRAFVKHIRQCDVGSCYYCGKNVPKGRRQIDHIVPLEKGGTDEVYNLCCACSGCNSKKHTHMPENFSGQYELLLGSK